MAKIVLNDGLILFEKVVCNVVETITQTVLEDGDSAATEIDAPSAAIGDYVLVSPGVDMQGLVYCAYVSDDDKVEIAIYNGTGGEVTLSESDWKVKVLR